MKKALGALIVLLLAASPAFAQKVTIDYAHDFDFSAVKTFQYVSPKEDASPNPLMAERIETLIKEKLVEGGLAEVADNPDVYITYHVAAQDQTVYNTTTMGYGGRWGGWRGWGASGMASSTTTAHTYTEGTLVIDLYDAREKKMIWRGTGTVTVKEKPEKRVEQIEKILEKLGDKWHKIIAGKGK